MDRIHKLTVSRAILCYTADIYHTPTPRIPPYFYGNLLLCTEHGNCHSEYGNEAWSSGSESPCCSSTLSSEHESTSGTTLTGSGLPMRKKRSGPGGKLEAAAVCRSHFSVAHGGFNDVLNATCTCTLLIWF